MRRSSLTLSVMLAGMVAACSETSDWALGPGGTALATRTEHTNDRLPFSLPDVDNPCTTPIEAIDMEGVIHGQGSLWDNDHFKSHYNVILTGTDADGVRYLGTSAGNGSGEFLGSPTQDVVISTVINSLGAYPNFTSKIVVHFMKDGTLRVEGSRCSHSWPWPRIPGSAVTSCSRGSGPSPRPNARATCSTSCSTPSGVRWAARGCFWDERRCG
jgi:hypothetical protein